MTHICVGNLTIIGSDNGLSPGRRQAITWTNAGLLLIGPLGTNFNEIFFGIQTFSFKKMHLKMLSGKWPPSCLGLNVLMACCLLGPVQYLSYRWLSIKMHPLITSEENFSHTSMKRSLNAKYSKWHHVSAVKWWKIFRKFVSRKTDYPRYNYGSPVTCIGHIWRPSDRLWTAPCTYWSSWPAKCLSVWLNSTLKTRAWY